MDPRSIDARRVAFFGGSFDPPHLGHLGVARAAQAALGLDTVLFAPVGAQPLKPQGSTACFEDRLAMTRLAIAGEPGFAVSLDDAPKSSGAPNYTLETLLTLRAELSPESTLFCLMGADAFAAFRHWHRAAEIPFVASLIVVSRPGESLHDLKAQLPICLTIEAATTLNNQSMKNDNHVAEVFDCKQALYQGTTSVVPQITPTSCGALAPEGSFSDRSPQNPFQFKEKFELQRCILRNPAGNQAPFYLLPNLEIEISASAIRAQLRAFAQAPPERALLPIPVSEYIRTHGLYR
jgi:nicotinate-nucleotide adenylyltransferase